MRELTEDEQKRVDVVKDQEVAFLQVVDSFGQSRELSLAKTKMEEASMWAVKHLTK